MEIHRRIAVMVWLSLGLVAPGLSVAQSSPGSGEEISPCRTCGRPDSMTSIS